MPLGEQGEEGFAFPEDTRALQRHLCVCQLSRALGLHHALNPEGKLRLITELRAHYRHGLKFGKSTDTDRTTRGGSRGRRLCPDSSLSPRVSNREQRPEDRAAVLRYVLSDGSSRIHRFMERHG